MTFSKTINKHLEEQAESDKSEKAQPEKKKTEKQQPVAITLDDHDTDDLVVKSTNSYGQFKIVNSNREVNATHVKKLKRAIASKNMLRLNPIVVNDNMEVIDGQHRLAAAKQLGLPIYYIQEKSVDRNDIANLNTNKKNWNIMDYVNFYAVEKYPDYVSFCKLCNEHPNFKTTWLQILCTSNGKRKTPNLKEGQIDISNIDTARTWIKYFEDWASYIPTVYSTRFIEGAIEFFKTVEYDHEIIMTNLPERLDSVRPCIYAAEYKRMLRKIYKTDND